MTESIKTNKWILFGYRYITDRHRPFQTYEEIKIIEDTIRDDLAKDLFDYEVEKIEKGGSEFVALQLVGIPKYGPAQRFNYDPKGLYSDEAIEDFNATYSAWCD